MEKPPVTDVEYELVDHRWRLPVKRTLFCAAYVGICASTAYHSNDPGLSAAMVCLAGVIWPMVRILAMVAEKVSPEQAGLLRERMITSPRRRQRRLSHQSR